jgi:hypothetical protein
MPLYTALVVADFSERWLSHQGAELTTKKNVLELSQLKYMKITHIILIKISCFSLSYLQIDIATYLPTNVGC